MATLIGTLNFAPEVAIITTEKLRVRRAANNVKSAVRPYFPKMHYPGHQTFFSMAGDWKFLMDVANQNDLPVLRDIVCI
ncbi:MAG: hypothetical protein IPH31_05645 [Lewinellaceae bacterium]|nr:hypothetical protein [Lewinellaceae bacterium]